MRVEGQKKRGGVGEASSLATQWLGDVPGSALFCREMGKLFVLSRVQFCSEKLLWGRVWMVEWMCQLVTARLGIVVLLGTVGKCQPTKRTQGTCAMRAFWFMLFSTFLDRHHRMQKLITSHCFGTMPKKTAARVNSIVILEYTALLVL